MYHDFEYLRLLKNVYSNGDQSDDRTGTGTCKMFGPQMRFPLTQGFPLLTTKRINFKAVVNELLWMVCEGSTDVKWLQSRGHTFWNPWALKDCTIGKGYGHQFRHVEVIRVGSRQTRIKNKPFEPPFSTDIELDLSNNKYQYVGVKFKSKHCGDFVVVREIPPNKHPGGGQPTKFEIQFKKTGYKTILQNKHQLENREIRDPYYPRLNGVGFLGDYDKDDPAQQSLHKIWSHMLNRCYDKSNLAYASYGGIGVQVCDQWLCFANFQKDVKNLHNWEMKLEEWDLFSLDKDILGGYEYSPTTCVWASKAEQSRNRSHIKLLRATHEDGRSLVRFGLTGIEKATGVPGSNLGKVLKGERSHAGGWSLEAEDIGDGFTSVMIIDQVKKAIAQIKHTPNSRRIIIDLWNPGELMEMALPPCHMMSQFQVNGNKLNSLLYQRSVDTVVGLPWNIAFYALLNIMIAHICDLQPGEFIWTGGDTHIYNNHMEQVEEQLNREARPSPALKVHGPKSLEGWKFEDFELIGYDPHPAIKAKVSV